LGTAIFRPRGHDEQNTITISDGIAQTLKNAVSFTIACPQLAGALANGYFGNSNHTKNNNNEKTPFYTDNSFRNQLNHVWEDYPAFCFL
jgi:hypothetical protein